MRKITKNALFFFLILFGLVAAAPEKTKGIFLITGIFDCCQGTFPNAYCEKNACWLAPNCDDDEDCNAN